jgi:hypothetical protein
VSRFEIDQRRRGAIDRFNAVMQPVLDRLRDRCTGMAVDEVRDLLSRAWGGNAGKPLPEPYLTMWATKLSNGERIVLPAG